MTIPTLPQRDRIPVTALYLGERLEHREMEREDTELGWGRHMLPVGEGGCAVLFRFGVVVLFGVEERDEAAFLERVQPLLRKSFETPWREEMTLVIGALDQLGPSSSVQLAGGDVARLAVVADALAKSVVLERYESEVEDAFEQIEPMAEALRHGGRVRAGSRELLRHIGDVLLAEQRTVGRAAVSERPDSLWEHPELERLHHELAEELELRERDHALERKLSTISHASELLLELQHTRSSLRVEWYITILIVVEIGLTLYEMWWK
ncbi:RMD1 family protein [Magnetofaba australis]|uniref:DUF155 domain-containing protein n=1 Tax=Magnetofaba australis IT-1 TaxID=1434232 RepID=A0A1Y2KA61_9PROT|nr:RMD1 family protein [Magnetofaba australis]OSM06804.1 hypothetical protein MAIT1_00329 [Magnetofaba australis IT-1]